jgi:hypothetical protein
MGFTQCKDLVHIFFFHFFQKWLVLKNEKLPKWALHFFKCPQMLDNMPSNYIRKLNRSLGAKGYGGINLKKI